MFPKEVMIHTNLRKLPILVTIAAALVTAPALVLGPQVVQAQQGQSISGSGTGQVNCPVFGGVSGASPPGDERISFVASKTRGTVSGSWSIFPVAGPFIFKQGSITGGHIGGQEFTLIGTEFTDTMCVSQVPAQITIEGECGQGVTIEFRSSNGQAGEFTGSVVCNK
jgi:hypothetical protein